MEAPAVIPALPVALAAVSWLGSGVIFGRQFRFAAGWLFFALGSVAACALAGPMLVTVAVAVNVPVAAALWYLSPSGGRHARPTSFRTAVAKTAPRPCARSKGVA